MRRRETVVVAIAVGVACIAGLLLTLPKWSFRRTVAELGSSRAELRREAVDQLRYSNDRRVPELLAASLADPAPSVRRSASRAIARRQFMNLAEVLLAAAEAETHAYTRLAMMQQWSDLVWPNGDTQLERWAHEPEPWSQLAAAYGALRRGRPDAASTLFELARSSDSKIRLLASRTLRDVCVPVIESHGGCETTFDDASDPMGPPDVERLEAWWGPQVSPDMLWRAARWQYDRPKQIRIVGKLFRNRQRFARWLGLS
ncbi:MAG TPA: hypothetical protein VMZ31_08030 [Phycisphaerae bacterium]|nr:hypothetical protein [Phycisphaerae bacterium]